MAVGLNKENLKNKKKHLKTKLPRPKNVSSLRFSYLGNKPY